MKCYHICVSCRERIDKDGLVPMYCPSCGRFGSSTIILEKPPEKCDVDGCREYPSKIHFDYKGYCFNHYNKLCVVEG
ncbi:MAG: hypothetical protein IMZ52_01075 [Actinobacteria bacterium]|nr:hypothetical protein [Actinomycetota bacterium]MBE3114730.1 hypothetical protein [Actinomycetota bacterium]